MIKPLTFPPSFSSGQNLFSIRVVLRNRRHARNRINILRSSTLMPCPLCQRLFTTQQQYNRRFCKRTSSCRRHNAQGVFCTIMFYPIVSPFSCYSNPFSEFNHSILQIPEVFSCFAPLMKTEKSRTFIPLPVSHTRAGFFPLPVETKKAKPRQ